MRTLLGKTLETLATELEWDKPTPHYYSDTESDGFSIFIGEDEFLFYASKLRSVELKPSERTKNVLGIDLPVKGRIEKLLTDLSVTWKAHGKYCSDHWFVIQVGDAHLNDCGIWQMVLYEFEFNESVFCLQQIRVEEQYDQDKGPVWPEWGNSMSAD